jgi:hypothetical protein
MVKKSNRRFRYAVLLGCLLYLLVLGPFMPDMFLGLPLAKLTVSVLLLAAAFSISNKRWTLAVSALLGLPAVYFSWSGVSDLSTREELIQGVFFLFVTILIHSELIRDNEVTLNTVIGSVAGFLMFAVAFGMLFMTIEDLIPGSFISANDGEVDLIYFSLVTISTLGYGDIVPFTPQARMLASMEAVFGQFYFAILVARLMSLYMEGEILAKNRLSASSSEDR